MKIILRKTGPHEQKMLASSLQPSFNAINTHCTQFPSSNYFLMKDEGLAIHILSPPHLKSVQQDSHWKTWHVGHKQWRRLWVFWVLEEIWCGSCVLYKDNFLSRNISWVWGPIILFSLITRTGNPRRQFFNHSMILRSKVRYPKVKQPDVF